MMQQETRTVLINSQTENDLIFITELWQIWKSICYFNTLTYMKKSKNKYEVFIEGKNSELQKQTDEMNTDNLALLKIN